VDKENHQELLNKLLKQVYKDLKKRMFPRKHIKLLEFDFDIAVIDLHYNILGRYESEKIGKYKCKHHIFINSDLLIDYTISRDFKKYYKQKIKNTIAHELIHAYTYERHEGLCDIEGVHMDASPIFLGILAYLKLPSGHKSWQAFIRTELYKKIKMCNTYDEAETLLIVTILEHERAVRELEYITEGNNIYHNKYVFGYGDVTGIKGDSTVTFNNDGRLCKACSFVMGPCVDLTKLKDLTLKKIKSNSFEHKFHGKFVCQSIADKRDKLHLQSMNI
jgi:hypothetical protein